MIAAAILMALSALETIVAVLQSGVFCLLRGFYVTEVLRRKDPLASALSFLFFIACTFAAFFYFVFF